MTLRLRFTLFFSALVLFLLTIFSAVLFHQVKENALETAENYLKSLTEHEWEHLDLPSHQGLDHTEAPHYRNVYLQIWKEGSLVYDSYPKPDRVQEKIFHTFEGEHEGLKYRVTGFYDLTLIQEHLTLFRRYLILGCVIALLFIVPLSFILTKVFLTPFRELANLTSQLNAENLSFRLPAPKFRDEYGVLASNFNGLFNRLEKSFLQIRNFAVSASHELRTPLSVIITQGERALRKPPEKVADSTVILQKILQSAMHLRSIINRLFVLSEVDRLNQEIPTTDFILSKAVEEALQNLKEPYQSDLKHISVEADENQPFRGNRELFMSLISNLIENSLKYSKEEINVKCEMTKSGLELCVEDDGPGIPPEQRNKVFEPFYRMDSPPEKSVNSHGLGLSIVKACLEAQKGTIELGTSFLGGLKVIVKIPSHSFE